MWQLESKQSIVMHRMSWSGVGRDVDHSPKSRYHSGKKMARHMEETRHGLQRPWCRSMGESAKSGGEEGGKWYVAGPGDRVGGGTGVRLRR